MGGGSSDLSNSGVVYALLHFSQLRQLALPSYVTTSSLHWVMQQLDKHSVVEPTWLPSSNQEDCLCCRAPLRVHVS